MSKATDRRQHPRFVLPSMYTTVEVRPLDCQEFVWKGHAYDISEGGMRFELDQPVAPGTKIAVRVELPGADRLRLSDRKPVDAIANVVWVEEDDVEHGGPVRMACVFTDYAVPSDRERLQLRLNSGRYSRAA